MRLHRLFFDHAWPAEMRIPDGMKEQHEKRLMRVKTYSNGQRSNTNLMPVRSYRRDIVNGTKLEPRAVSKESKDEPTLKMSVPEIKYSFEIQSPQKQVISL